MFCFYSDRTKKGIKQGFRNVDVWDHQRQVSQAASSDAVTAFSLLVGGECILLINPNLFIRMLEVDKESIRKITLEKLSVGPGAAALSPLHSHGSFCQWRRYGGLGLLTLSLVNAVDTSSPGTG